MKQKKFFYWLPRLLAILFTLFLVIFAFDVFDGKHSVLEMIGGFLIHLTPNYLLLISLLIAWKHEKIGGLIFLIIATFFTLFFKTYLYWPVFLTISFPVLLIGLLFLWHSYAEK